MKPSILFCKIIGLFILCAIMQSSFAAGAGASGFSSTNPGVVSNRLSQQSQYYQKQAVKKNQNRAPVIIYKKPKYQ